MSLNRSAKEVASAAGTYSRNRTMPGVNHNAGVVALPSQLRTLVTLAPMRAATALWVSPRSNRRFRIWSPKLFSFLG
jgi:hypothetical protein